MPIDISMYNNTPDIGASFERGMRLGDMYKTRKKENEIQNAFQKNTTVDASGKAVVNQGALLSDLTKGGYTQEALQQQQQFAQQKQQQAEQTLHTTTQAFAGMQDPISYAQNRKSLIDGGYAKPEEIPEQYNPKFVQDHQMGLLSIKEQLDQKNKQQEMGIKWAELEAKKNEKSAKDKEMSVTQAKQMGLYNQGSEAEKQYKEATTGTGWDRFDPSSSWNLIDKNDWAPKLIKSKESMRAESAQDRWVESFLRDASGAAIKPEERGSYAKDFFPVAGDSKEIVADKAKARQVKMESARVAAGGEQQMQASNQPPQIQQLHSLPDDALRKIYNALPKNKMAAK